MKHLFPRAGYWRWLTSIDLGESRLKRLVALQVMRVQENTCAVNANRYDVLRSCLKVSNSACFNTKLIYESCYVRPLGPSSVLRVGYNRLRWRNDGSDEPPTKFKSRASHHHDHSVFHRCRFSRNVGHDHGLRVYFQLDGSLEWSSDNYYI
jgi:hypothetical protein